MRRLFIVAAAVTLVACSGSTEITSGECTRIRAFDKVWVDLTDQELRVEIARACGRVFIGFKEAGQPRGVDPHGKSLTTAETYAAMKAWIVEGGIEIEWEGIDLPHVAATMPWTQDLVNEVRHHPNVDYLEPIFPGVRFGAMRELALEFESTGANCTSALVATRPSLTGGRGMLVVDAVYGAPNGGFAFSPSASWESGHLGILIAGENRGGIAVPVCYPYRLTVAGLSAGRLPVVLRHADVTQGADRVVWSDTVEIR